MSVSFWFLPFQGLVQAYNHVGTVVAATELGVHDHEIDVLHELDRRADEAQDHQDPISVGYLPKVFQALPDSRFELLQFHYLLHLHIHHDLAGQLPHLEQEESFNQEPNHGHDVEKFGQGDAKPTFAQRVITGIENVFYIAERENSSEQYHEADENEL